MSILLDVKNLGISFGGLRAVNEFDLTIQKEQLYGLIGPNGAGKTTVFNLLTEEDIRIWSTTGPGVLAIYFWAPWHGPSRMYASRFEKVAEWYTNEECYFGKINFEDIDQQIRTKYGVNEMPTTFIIKQNEIVAKAVGIIEESTLKALVNQYKATATKRTSPD